MHESLNVLFTSVGRRVALLKVFRDAFHELEIDGRIVAIDKSPYAPALQYADESYIVPALDDSAYAENLLEIAAHEKVTAIFPLIDPDVGVLLRAREQLAAVGTRLATVSPASAEVVGDKWKTYRLFQSLDVDTPESWLPEDRNPDAVEYPVFIKPRHGSSSADCFVVRDAEQLKFFSKYVHRPIVQEFLPGTQITNDVICDLDGDVLSVVSRERIAVRGGEVTIGRTVHDANIARRCEMLARAVQATGPITIQCILKNGTPYFTEINARFGGGAPCGILAGATWPEVLISRLCGLDCETGLLQSYREGVIFSRYQESLDITSLIPVSPSMISP